MGLGCFPPVSEAREPLPPIMFLRNAAVSTRGAGLSGVGWVIMMPGVGSGHCGVTQAVISMSVLSSLEWVIVVDAAPGIFCVPCNKLNYTVYTDIPNKYQFS